jgi:hypothetical protein
MSGQARGTIQIHHREITNSGFLITLNEPVRRCRFLQESSGAGLGVVDFMPLSRLYSLQYDIQAQLHVLSKAFPIEHGEERMDD